MSWGNFKYEKSSTPERAPGVYRALIIAAEITTSRSSGKKMLKISLRPSGSKAIVYGYILDNDHFDQNFSEFIDAFPEIRDKADAELCTFWVGAEGAVKLVVDEKGFWKTAQFPWVSAAKAEALPPYVWTPREDEPIEKPVFGGFALLSEDEDDLPFA